MNVNDAEVIPSWENPLVSDTNRLAAWSAELDVAVTRGDLAHAATLVPAIAVVANRLAANISA